MIPSMYKPLQIWAPPQTRNTKKPSIKSPLQMYLEIALKYIVKQSKNGNFPSNYKASPIDFETANFPP